MTDDTCPECFYSTAIFEDYSDACGAAGVAGILSLGECRSCPGLCDEMNNETERRRSCAEIMGKEIECLVHCTATTQQYNNKRATVGT